MIPGEAQPYDMVLKIKLPEKTGDGWTYRISLSEKAAGNAKKAAWNPNHGCRDDAGSGLVHDTELAALTALRSDLDELTAGLSRAVSARIGAARLRLCDEVDILRARLAEAERVIDGSPPDNPLDEEELSTIEACVRNDQHRRILGLELMELLRVYRAARAWRQGGTDAGTG